MPRVQPGSKQTWLSSGSEDEEGAAESRGQGSQVMDAVLERYLDELGPDTVRDDQVFSRGVARVKQYLATGTATASTCLICLGKIKPTEAVWSCGASCFSSYHMPCIQEWARNQMDAAVLRAMNRLGDVPGAAAQARAQADWGCPMCRHPYTARQVPASYLCFCGKQEDPEWDPWRAPHSCGELCGRGLGSGQGSACKHACLLLCHPGPCPPCPRVIDARCFCGSTADRRRCGHHEFSCGNTCNRKLPCGHPCRQACHAEDCPPCDVLDEVRCRCGAEVKRLACHERDFQCQKVCGKALTCGNHVCERVCHAGPCGACPMEGVRTCPCGQHEYTGLSCTDKTPTCGMTCDKMLPCGLHRCQDRCHVGECSSCRAATTKSCRCGKTSKEVTCGSDLLCERRCTNMKGCGRHACKRKCCDGTTCPPCEEVCGRKLRCGNHRCPAPCHSGPCRPCPLTVSFTCACSRLTTSLPCGAEGRAVAPRCFAPCSVPGLCRHAMAGTKPQHRCHYGPCPTCKEACGTQLPCGHTCGSTTCHDPPPPAVPEFKQPTAPKVHLTASSMAAHLGNAFGALGPAAGPSGNSSGNAGHGSAAGRTTSLPAAGDGQAPAAAAVAQQAQHVLDELAGKLPSSCPPCSVQVEVVCLGGHEAKQMDCCRAAPYRCDRKCGRLLSCGNHMCSMACHIASDSPGATPGSVVACEACTQACGRAAACGHVCAAPCHPGPCAVCVVPVKRACHCGKTSLSLQCKDVQTAGSGGHKDVLCCGKPCHKPLPLCPHPCRHVCHTGTCPGETRCDEEVTVRCACKRLKAKWKCADVQKALKAQGRPNGGYDALTPLRLLPCDKECGAAAQAQAAATPAAAAKQATRSAAPPVPAPGQAGESKGPSKVRLSKAEREAEAARKEQARLQLEQRQKLQSMLGWVVVVVLGVLLALGVPRVLAWFDQAAQEKWRLDKERSA